MLWTMQDSICPIKVWDLQCVPVCYKILLDADEI